MNLDELKALEFTLNQNILYSPNGTAENLLSWLELRDDVMKQIQEVN